MAAAAHRGSADCLKLLVARGVEANAKTESGCTALHIAAVRNHSQIVRLLLEAGPDPTIHDNSGKMPLDIVRAVNSVECITLLEAAFAEPERPRALLKARALLDVPSAIRKAHEDARAKGISYAAEQRAVLAVTPADLKRRVMEGVELPVLTEVVGDDEERLPCLKYVLGLEGGGGEHEGDGPPPQGMLPEVFVENRARVGAGKDVKYA